MGIDMETGQVTDFSKTPDTYNECEGIFPDGDTPPWKATVKSLNYEGEHGCRTSTSRSSKLDGTGKDFVRLTHFNDYEGWKASNPVISTDGKLMAFQVAHTSDNAGVGYGIILYRF